MSATIHILPPKPPPGNGAREAMIKVIQQNDLVFGGLDPEAIADMILLGLYIHGFFVEPVEGK
jgi:hypothetical protein